MPVSPNAKLYFKGVAVALIGVIVAVLGITAVGFLGDYSAVHPLRSTVMLSGSLGIDVLGAVVPLIVGLVAAALFVKSVSAPIKKLSLALFASVFLAFLLYHLTADGIAGSPLLFALVASAVAGSVTVFPKPFVDLRKNFVASLLLSLGCVPLAIFAVDVFYSRYFTCAAIGGSGLSDGMLLSTLYAPLCVAAFFSVLTYFSKTILLVRFRYTETPNKKLVSVKSER
jgi:hypothetical protein